MTWMTTIIWCAAVLCAGAAQAATPDPISALAAASKDRSLLLVGEMHGTQEVPALVGQLAAQLVHKGEKVVVGLEYPQGEDAHLQAYLRSQGSAADRARLLATPFWTRSFQDGRSSEAGLDLIESLRVQRQQGGKLRVVAFDMSPAQESRQVERDEAMADNLRAAVKANRGSRMIVLTGNYHARQSVGAPWNASHRFMGHFLTDLNPLSVDVRALGGAYWACFDQGCAVQQMGAKPATAVARGLYADPRAPAIGYQLVLQLDEFAASPPAVARR